MTIETGTRLGPYEIVALIGAGGMGEVYRATDSNLKRSVAIKVLPASMSGDAELLARFQREAEVLAVLNHPNIGAIYGLEKTPDFTALVMELVEGEDLSQRIARGAMAIDEALPIAKQIAEALETAHQQGIIHRDLKPANIRVRPDGTVKVLDFGLAKAMEPTAAMSSRVSMSPTIIPPAMTQAGIVLGTVAYMSPEQARGSAVDKRADLWAFGVVLFEMLSGTRLFDGATIPNTFALLLTKQPDWSALPQATPPSLCRLLRRCLEKDPARRLADASDARLEIEDALTEPPEAVVNVSTSRARSASLASRLGWIGAAVGTLVTLPLAVVGVRHLAEAPAAAPRALRLEVLAPGGAAWSPSPVAYTAQFAISPDGSRLAVVAGNRSEASRIWIRLLNRSDAQALAGTEGATFPFWSPDGRFVAFFAGGKLKKVAIAGGAPQTLCDVEAGRGGSWSPSGVILFARSNSPLYRLSADGGPVTEASRFDAAQEPIFHYWPQFLPDGRHFLYLQRSRQPEYRGIYVGSLDTPELTRVAASEVRGVFTRGFLLLVRDGLLFAQPFDDRTLMLSREPTRITDGVGFYTASYGYAAVDASLDGMIVVGPTLATRSRLRWLDRHGNLQSDGPEGSFSAPRLTTDQKTVAVVVRGGQRNEQDIWLFDVGRPTLSRVTAHPSTNWFPAWMPDGRQILFASTRDSSRAGAQVVYRKNARSIDDGEPLHVASPVIGFPDDVSGDGQFVLVHNLTSRGYDIAAYRIAADQPSRDVLVTPFNEVQPRFSPDGHWVAYASDESGRFEVYVRPFPFSAERTQVSTSGGMQPEWRRDSKEFFYISADRKVMAVPISFNGTTARAGQPNVLFGVDVVEPNPPYSNDYAVSADGQRFLVNTIVDEPTSQSLTILVNWQEDLKPR